MRWHRANRADPLCRVIADRHYNRQKIGSKQFVPPGRCLVLYAKTETGEALWITSWPFAEYVKHAWAGAFVCSAFRNEGAGLSSDLIREACAATAATWPIPDLGMVTFVNRNKVRAKRDPGRCFLRSGFRYAGETQGGLVALALDREAFPEPQDPLPSFLPMFDTSTKAAGETP